MKKLMKKFKNERGLTLVELLAVVVILAIIAVIAFVFIGGIIENSKKDAHIANAQQLIASAKLYEAEGETVDSTGVKFAEFMETGLLDKLIDPWTKVEYPDTTGIVYKDIVNDKPVYSVTLVGSECSMKNKTTEAELLAKEARKLCTTTP